MLLVLLLLLVAGVWVAAGVVVVDTFISGVAVTTLVGEPVLVVFVVFAAAMGDAAECGRKEDVQCFIYLHTNTETKRSPRERGRWWSLGMCSSSVGGSSLPTEET
jgi:hypothetical protein